MALRAWWGTQGQGVGGGGDDGDDRVADQQTDRVADQQTGLLLGEPDRFFPEQTSTQTLAQPKAALRPH